jgi:hypothetical protein
MNAFALSWSRKRLLVVGAVLFLSSLFFGGQASAAICTWSATTSQAASDLTNWDNGSGAACTQFTGNIFRYSNSVTSTNSTWDISTTTNAVLVDSNYTGTITVTSSLTTTGDFSQNGGTLHAIGGSTLTVGANLGVSSTAFNASGTISVAGNIDATTTLNMAAGTLTLSGTTKTIRASAGANLLFNNVSITGSYTLYNNATTTGYISVSGSGSLNLSTSTVSVADSFLNNGSSVTQSGGTVQMTGNSKYVGGTGNTTFYNLVLDQITNLNGNVTTTNNLTVTFNLTGTSSVDYYLVVGGNLSAPSSMQLGTIYGYGHLSMTGVNGILTPGTNFQVKELTIASGATTTISGTNSIQVFATTTVTGNLNAGGSTLTLAGPGSAGLSISGGFDAGTSTITFNGEAPVIPSKTFYNLTIGPSSSGSVTLAGAVTSTNLTLSSGVALLNLGTNNLVVSGNITNNARISQTSGSVTMSGSSASLITGSASSTQFYNLNVTGTTTLYGVVTSSNIVIVAGVLSAGTSTLTLSGTSTLVNTPLIIQGTFNSGSSTVIYSGATTTVASTTYYNLTINSSGTASIVGATNPTNNLTINSGGNLDLAAAATFSGDVVNSGSFTSIGGYVLTLNGSSKNFGGTGTTNLYQISISGGSRTLTGDISLSNILLVNGTSILNAAGKTVTLTGTGEALLVSPTAVFNSDTSTIVFSGATANIASTTYYNLTVNNATLGALTGSTTVNNVLTVNASKVFDAGSAQVSLYGTVTPFVVNGSFTASSSNFVYHGATATIASTTFYDLTVNNGTSGTLAGTTTINHVLTVNASKTLDPSNKVLVLLATGTPFVKNGTLASSTGNIIKYSGAGTTYIATSTNYYGLEIDSTAAVLLGNVEMNNLQINSGKALDAGGYTVTLDGSTTPFVKNGTFTASTSTVVYAGSSATNIASTTYYNLTVGTVGTLLGNVTTTNLTVNSSKSLNLSTYDAAISGNISNSGSISQTSGTVTVSGASASVGGSGNTTVYNLTVSGTATLNSSVTSTNVLTVSGTLNASTSTIYLTGTSAPFSVSGTFNANTSTVIYSGNSATVGTSTYYNLTVNGTSQTLGGAVTTTNNFTVNSGKSVDLISQSLNVGTNLNNSGTITDSSQGGTVTMNGTGNLGGSGSTSMFHLTIKGNVTLAGNVTSTGYFTILASKTFTATGYNVIANMILNSGTFAQVDSGSVTLNSNGGYYSAGSSDILYDLIVNSNSSLNGVVTTTHVVTINSGKILTLDANVNLKLTATGTPLLLAGSGNLSTTGQGIVTYSGATANIASTTYYNLVVDNGTAGTLTGSTTVNNVLTINSGKTLNAGSNQLTLAGASTPFVNSGTFTSASSTVLYSTSSSANITGETYWNLTLGSGTYTMASTVTSTNTLTNGGTLTINSGKNLVVPGTFTNNGTITETGAIIHPNSYVRFSDSVGVDKSSYDGNVDTLYVTVRDDDANKNASSAETMTATVTTGGDSESITLTETAVSSGIFRGSITFLNGAVNAGDGLLNVGNGTGSLSLAFTDSKDGTDTGSDTATYTYVINFGGGGSGGSAPSVSSANTAVQAVSTPAQATSQTVKLDFSIINAKQMVISEDPGFAGAVWETYASTKDFTLSAGAGKKTIYAKFRSAQGLVTETFKAVINLVSGYKPAAPAAVTPAPASKPVVVSDEVVSSFTLSNPASKVVIAPVKQLDYKPGSAVKYTYSYKNETTKPLKVSIVRQVVDANGKVISQATGSRTLSKGQKMSFNATSALSNKLAVGTYTVKVKILDAKKVVLDENSFDFTVKK